MFINRVGELRLLQEYHSSQRDTSKYVTIIAPSGYGKSALVDKTFSKLDKFIRIKVPKHSAIKNTPSLHIIELGRSLDISAQRGDSKQTLYDFLNEKGRLIGDVAADILKNNKYVKSESASNAIRKKFSNKENLFFDSALATNYDKAKGDVYSYVKTTLYNKKYTIAVENIQDIDYESLQFLRELLSINRSIFIIGEYTLGSSNQIASNQLINYLSGPYIESDTLTLEKLDLNEIISALKDYSIAIVTLIKKNYNESSGNLYPLKFLLQEAKKEKLKFNDYKEIILESLKELTEIEKTILASIIAHSGKIEIDFFEAFTENSNISGLLLFEKLGLNEILTRLKDKDLITISTHFIQVYHDSVIEEFQSAFLMKKYLLVSYQNWQLFYKELKRKSNYNFISKSEIVSWEIYFKIVLKDIGGLNNLLEEIYDMALYSSSPRRAIRHLQNIKHLFVDHSVLDEVKIHIDLKIIQIFYRLNCFEEVIEISSQYVSEPLILLFHASSLALIGKAKKAIKICTNLIDDDECSDYTLVAYIIRIAAYRSSNKYEECEQEWLRLYKLNIFKNRKIEALFYQSSDLALMNNNELRIKYLKKAIDLFQNTNQLLSEVWTRNALVQHLGYDGKLKIAEEELLKCEGKLSSIMPNNYVIVNNQCVLSMQKGLCDSSTVNRLENAGGRCDTILDKFIIWNNLLVANSMIQNIDQTEEIIRVIEQITYNKEVEDYDLQRIALFNIYIHYQKYNDANAKSYLQAAQNLPILGDKEFWYRKLYDQNDKSDDFRLTLDYYPVYISSWSFNFDNLLMNSES